MKKAWLFFGRLTRLLHRIWHICTFKHSAATGDITPDDSLVALSLDTSPSKRTPPPDLPKTKRSPSQSPSKAPLVAPWHSLFLRHLDRILCSSPGDLCAWGWEASDKTAAFWGLLAWMGSSFSLSHPPPPPLLTACPLGDKEEINTELLFIPHDPNSNVNWQDGPLWVVGLCLCEEKSGSLCQKQIAPPSQICKIKQYILNGSVNYCKL